MRCPHCRQEHSDFERVCPTTGLPLGQPVACPSCGQEARPGARFCAACGATLPRAQPPISGSTDSGEASDSPPAPAPVFLHSPPSTPPSTETHPTLPAGSQGHTRPSVPLVELSRRETRPSSVAIPTSTHAGRRSRFWSFVGYALLILVLLAGAAGLFLLWGQLRPQQAAISPASPTEPAPATLPTATDQPTTLVAVLPTGIPASPPASATPEPVLVSPTMTATPPTNPISSASPTPTAWPYHLAFYSSRNEQPGIYLWNLDRPEDTLTLPLPEGYDIAVWPAFCGNQVAYEVQDRALTLPRWIYRYDLADQSLQPIEPGDLEPLRLSEPGCSPDGRFLSFSAYLDGDWELVVMELASGEILYRYKSPEYPQVGHATWSNDQDVLWWMGLRVNGFYDINETQDFLDSSTRQTRTVAKGKYPVIAPDGSRLAFFCGNLLYLCVARVPSGEIIFQIPVSYFKLINDQPVAASASWSSDGQWLYFTSSITGNWDIYRVRADGSQAQNLTESWPTDEFMPAAR